MAEASAGETKESEKEIKREPTPGVYDKLNYHVVPQEWPGWKGLRLAVSNSKILFLKPLCRSHPLYYLRLTY